ncbi:hypothetical protein ACSSUQ_004245 [Yersinia enterocolitica]
MKSLIMRVKDVAIEKIGLVNVLYLIYGGILLSLSMITQIYIPDEFKKNNNWITFVLIITFMSGIFITLTGLLSFLIRMLKGKLIIAGVIMMGMVFFIPPNSMYGLIPMLGTLITMSILFS